MIIEAFELKKEEEERRERKKEKLDKDGIIERMDR